MDPVEWFAGLPEKRQLSIMEWLTKQEDRPQSPTPGQLSILEEIERNYR